MPRTPNTTTSGSQFSQATIEAVWNKAKDHPRFPPLKQDACEATIARSDYGENLFPIRLGG